VIFKSAETSDPFRAATSQFRVAELIVAGGLGLGHQRVPGGLDFWHSCRSLEKLKLHVFGRPASLQLVHDHFFASGRTGHLLLHATAFFLFRGRAADPINLGKLERRLRC